MIIDFHTHIFPDPIAKGTILKLQELSHVDAATYGTADELVSSMKESGVDVSIIQPVVTAPRQFSKITEFANYINENYTDGRLLSFGGVHPESDSFKDELKQLKEMGFHGIKLHPDYQGVFFNDINYKRIVSYATELGFIILVHAGIDIGMPTPIHCTPAMSLEVLKDTEADKLVLAHLGGWKQWDEVEEFLVGQNVYLDTAFLKGYMDQEQFRRIVKNHGSDKILFGTDSPWTAQTDAINWIKDCDFTPIDEENIFSKTALSLLPQII